MMAKLTALKTVSKTELINCENCRQVNGKALDVKVKCEKGHDAELSYSTLQDNCTDYSPPTQDELIFKLFGTNFGGDASLDIKKANVRRTSTYLRNAMVAFEKILNLKQIEVIKEAIDVFDRLGDDVGVAAQLARQLQGEKEAKYANERQMKLDKIADDFFGNAKNAEIVAIADDLAAFTSNLGANWYRQRTANEDVAMPVLVNRLAEPIRRYRATPTLQRLNDIKTRVAEYVEEFNRRYHYSTNTMMDYFQLFRVWRAEQREVVNLSELDSSIV